MKHSPVALAAVLASLPLTALGQTAPDGPSGAPLADNGTPSERVPRSDPTGGAYTSPTLLFVPAGALPTLNVRVIPSMQLQGPADVNSTVRPGLGAELGLGRGFTVGIGTQWTGGDTSAGFDQGLSPYAQVRFQILGARNGVGFSLGTSVAYKAVGFQGDPGEMELGVSAQYRQRRYEVGLQGVFGQDFGDAGRHDGELHAYALYRIIPELGVGGAVQGRLGLSNDSFAGPKPDYDLQGGAIASLTLGVWQLGLLAGATSVGLVGQTGALAHVFGSVRF